jgi:acetyltransferase-like isoleucine patch superfamily enzyme
LNRTEETIGPNESGTRRHDRLTRYPSGDANSLWVWQRQVSLVRVTRNFLVVYVCRYLPNLGWKNTLYRRLGAHIGRRAAFGLSATIDVFFPELVSVGDNSIIGYNTIILCHEYLRHELRTGRVVIGRDVVVGASCTILPGVVIGDGAVVSALSLVNKDVPAGSVVGGVPARPLSGDQVDAEDSVPGFDEERR